jgi:hypothetical protein
MKPQAFKLHGSVDWHREEQGEGESRTAKYTPTGKSEYAVECAGKHIGISTPGPTKRIATKDLELLWTEALKRLKGADVVVFVGYRFPPSDAEAREKLLKALRENTRPHVELNIVLGPERDKDVVRLEQLLLSTMSRERQHDFALPRAGRTLRGPPRYFAMTTHALYAEDFFTVWSRDLIWPKDLRFEGPS